MLRSLLAIIIAVIVGLAAAKLSEATGLAIFASPSGALYAALLVAGWGAAAFLAAAVALLIDRRWAPVGWLAAATMLLQSVLALSSAQQGAPVFLAAVLVTTGAGFGAIKLLRGTYQRQAGAKNGPFP